MKVEFPPREDLQTQVAANILLYPPSISIVIRKSVFDNGIPVNVTPLAVNPVSIPMRIGSEKYGNGRVVMCAGLGVYERSRVLPRQWLYGGVVVLLICSIAYIFDFPFRLLDTILKLIIVAVVDACAIIRITITTLVDVIIA